MHTTVPQLSAMSKTIAEASLHTCPTTGGTYQAREIRESSGYLWAACPLHDAMDHERDDDAYTDAFPQWHVIGEVAR